MVATAPPPFNEKISQRLSVTLDASRWIAAALVLLSHINGRVFLAFPMSAESDRTGLFYCWTFLCGFSHQAVMVFFVLSGFLVGGSHIKDYKSGMPDLMKYSASRISRLYSVLLPALALTIAFDYVGISASPLEGYIGDRYRGMEFGQILCNASFLQTIICEPLGSNQPLWSLANEFWYYVLFPIFAFALSSKHIFYKGVIAIFFFTGIVAFLTTYPGGAMILLYAHIWVLGAWASSTQRVLIKNDIFAWSIFIVVLVGSRIIFRAAIWRDPYFGWLLDTVVALLFSQALIATKLSSNSSTLYFSNIHKWLSDRSFSVYAIHLPVCMMLIALCNNLFGMPWNGRPLPMQTLWGIAITVATLGVCLLFHLAFEARHLMVRKFLLDGLHRISTGTRPYNVSLENIER